MEHDRIIRICVSGMRVVEDAVLDLNGLTVLIGDNGTGKSTLLEAVELLRQAATPRLFVDDVLVLGHGGLRSLLRRDSSQLRLQVVVGGAGPQLEYRVAVGLVGNAPQVIHEYLDVRSNPSDAVPLNVLARRGERATITDAQGRKQPELTGLHEGKLVVASFGIGAQPAFQRLVSALERIEHHVPFETRPLWQQRELELRSGARWPEFLAERQRHILDRYALNLSGCYQHLRNLGGKVWERVVERARLGLGNDLRDFALPPAGRGAIELQLVFGSTPKPVPLDGLSEGQLAYLAFIALAELNHERSLLVFDEPELHLHPALLSRVVGMLEEVAETCPVLIATQSDRLLDALSKPADTVVLCELNERGSTQLRKPNAESLAEWLKSYRGIGSLRAEGYEANIFNDGEVVSGTGERQ
jgi:predicted ATPase